MRGAAAIRQMTPATMDDNIVTTAAAAWDTRTLEAIAEEPARMREWE